MSKIKTIADALIQTISKDLIDKEDKIKLTLVCLIAGGHLLLEDVPGLGKTTLAKSLANCLKADFKRIQCTPDLMPSDITGVTIYNQKNQSFEFIQGPVFSQILLADEINRTNPKTQSALLEAMAEATVSVDRQTHQLHQPFFVIATQNPVEFGGTYPLPEAQMDRFMMRISLGYPNKSAEVAMLKSLQIDKQTGGRDAVISCEQLLQIRQYAQKVTVSEEVFQYIVAIVDATRHHDAVALGASPRASLALMKSAQALAVISGHNSVTPEMIQIIAEPVLAHRLIFKNKQISGEAKKRFFAELLTKSVFVPDHANAPS